MRNQITMVQLMVLMIFAGHLQAGIFDGLFKSFSEARNEDLKQALIEAHPSSKGHDVSEHISLLTSDKELQVYNVIGNLQLFHMVNQVIYDIITSQPGEQFCQYLYPLTRYSLTPTQIIRVMLGVSPPVADQIHQFCQRQPKANPVSKYVKSPISLPLSPHVPNSIAIRRYWIVLSNTAQPYYSLTLSSNDTLLLFQKNELTYENLLISLSHELAIYFDGKYAVDDLLFDKILNHQFKFNNRQDLCVAINKINHPIMQYSLAAIRAYQFELEITNWFNQRHNLDLTPAYNKRQLTSADFTLKVMSHLWNHHKLLWGFSRYARPDLLEMLSALIVGVDGKDVFTGCRPQRYSIGENMRLEDSSLPEDLNDLDQIMGTYQSNSHQTPMSIFEFLMIPFFSDRNLGLTNGPRPRIEGGW